MSSPACADCGKPKEHAIHKRGGLHFGCYFQTPPKGIQVKQCGDCGRYGVITGHMDCMYPGSRVPS